MKFLFAGLALVGLVSVQAGSCGKHEQFANGKCVCKLGYTRHQGVCKRCPEHSKYSCTKNRCVCANGYTFDSQGFQCIQNYQHNDYDNSHGGSYGYDNSHGGSYGYDNSHGGSYGHYCGPNEIPIPGGGCDCDYRNGYARLDGVHCLRCPQNGHWQPQWNSCVCNYDFKFDGAGNCVPDCKLNEVFTPGGGCTCKPKFNKYDGVNCTRCPPRSYYDVASDDCICEWGFVMQNYKCVPKSH